MDRVGQNVGKMWAKKESIFFQNKIINLPNGIVMNEVIGDEKLMSMI